ncbi:hypothetical protein COOONC_06222 [Cooperia oncophora]
MLYSPMKSADEVFAVMNVQKVRWHGCVTRINSLMPMATSSIYVKHHFDHEAKKQLSVECDERGKHRERDIRL